MFERFTDRTRRVVVLAQDQARELRHGRLLTVHLLLGILAVRDEATISGASGASGSAPPEAAVAAGVDLATIRAGIDEPETQTLEHLPFSAAAKRVLEFALREALQRGHADIDVRHVLLALLRDDTGADAPRLLATHAVDVAHLRTRTEASLNNHPPRPGP